jgi:hypothetical protein
MTHLAGYCDTRTAQRLTNTIFSIRIVLTSLIVLMSARAAYIAYEAESSLLLLVIGVGAMMALSVYVTFGWLEQTLVLLIGIAHNTAQEANVTQPVAARATVTTQDLDPTPKPKGWTEKQERAYQELLRGEQAD